jgi:Cof subfamily protein (haloacid dehalogenase superfamily)
MIGPETVARLQACEPEVIVTAHWAVFLDVDGTLVNDRGEVPDSARSAVRRARANGHRVFLCTGRSTSQIWPEIHEIGFDGLVAAAGGYVEVEGEVLANHGIPDDEVRRVVAYFSARGVDYMLESNSGLYGSERVRPRLRELFYGGITDEDLLAEMERGLAGFIDSISVGEVPAKTTINKILFLDSGVTLEEIRQEFGTVFQVLPASVPSFGPNSGELAQRGVHKGLGIDIVIDHLGIDRQRTLAIGDGYNDLEMLEQVATGIAMGNAPREVQAVADEVTGTPDEDGVAAALRRHGLG